MSSVLPGLALGTAAGLLDTLLVKQGRSIGNIVPDCTIEESHSDELEITQHPIEFGAQVSDHAYKKRYEFTMRLGWTASRPITSLGQVGDIFTSLSGFTGQAYIRDVYNQLLTLQATAEPFTVVTGKRTYTDAMIKGLRVSTDKTTENILAVEARFEQARIVYTQVATLPPVTLQAIPQQTAAPVDAGTKQPQAVNTSILGSILGTN